MFKAVKKKKRLCREPQAEDSLSRKSCIEESGEIFPRWAGEEGPSSTENDWSPGIFLL